MVPTGVVVMGIPFLRVWRLWKTQWTESGPGRMRETSPEGMVLDKDEPVWGPYAAEGKLCS